MLERIREGSQGIVAKSILGLVILTFAISGIGSYINSQADTAVAVVNDVEISQSSFEQAYQNERSRLQQQFGEMAEQLMADEGYLNGFRQNILERLILEELQKQQAKEIGIRVSDQQIKDAILSMPQFQQAGEFNNDVYLAVLRQAGFQPNQFREYMREQMVKSQFEGAIMASEFVLPKEQQTFDSLAKQTRSFDQYTISAEQLKATVTASEEELDSFYQANKFNYQTEEKVAIDYILVDSAKLATNLSVTDEELQTYYEDNLDVYTQEEKRKVSHILVEFGDDQSAAKQKIDQLKANVDAGEDFATLAMENSTDTFSAENGGDLGWVEQDLMGEAFDNAVFALTNIGEVSNVVETEFGYHLIKLTELQAKQVKAFEEVKAEISATMVENKVSDAYVEAQTNLVEMAFEVPDTLEDAAQAAGLTVSSTQLSTRTQLPVELMNPQVVSKLFDQDFIAEGLNSDLIELSDTLSVVVRVNDYEAQKQQSLEEVKDLINDAVIAEKSQKLAAQQATELLAKLKAGDAAESANAQFERKDEVNRLDASVHVDVRKALFKLPKPDTAKQFDLVELANGDAVIIALDKVGQRLDEAESTTEAQFQSLVARISATAYFEALKSAADIQKNL